MSMRDYLAYGHNGVNSVLESLALPVTQNRLSETLTEHFRCPDSIPEMGTLQELGGAKGFFACGPSVFCFGRARGPVTANVSDVAYDASRDIRAGNNALVLPFDLTEVVNNLRYERYVTPTGWQGWVQESLVRDIYYRLRPFIPVSLRKHLQQLYLNDWNAFRFPNWPVDRTVDVLFDKMLALAIGEMSVDRLPFVWFWPKGHKACAIMTHDVETTEGRDYCSTLMDIDDSFGIKASFQVVPEERYTVPPSYLQMIRDRGFEVNVQGLNHDGNLFRGRKLFLQKAARINRYAAEFGSLGFRSPVLYRNIDWFQDMDFSYDMSVPNVARLEAQRGGCCTVFPYFLPGGVVELPLTTTEDYTLFHILNDYSIKLWKEQIRTIRDGYGLISFIIHPDYVNEGRANDTFKKLLAELVDVSFTDNVWLTLPREVDRWWRERSKMRVVPKGTQWAVEGSGSERATIAYARVDGERLVYEFD